MDNRIEINKLDNSTNTRIGPQVGGSAVVHGNIQNDQSVYNYNAGAGTLILNQNKGQIDPINFNFDLEALQGTTANRDAELEQMCAVLAKPTTGSGAKFVVLVGMGGAGKTTLAKMYFKAENDREPFDHLIWIDAEEPENVAASFKQLTNYLGIQHQFAGEKELINAVYNSVLKQKAIIVFDNVEQVERIRQFFPKLVSPKNPPPHVIVTTRIAGGWQNYKDHLVSVGELSMQVCKDFIRDSLASLNIPDVDQKGAEFAEHFGRLVMALRTATMSIVEQNSMHDADDEQPYTLEEFLKEAKETRVVEDEENQGLFDPVEATYRPLRQLWTATLDNLSKQIYGQLGERILQVLAFLSPVGVPVTWIRIICADLLGPNNKIMMHATHFMISRSLMTKSESKYIVHRVFQSTLLDRIKPKLDTLTSTMDWLLPGIEQLYLELAAENNLQDFYPHLHTLLKHIELRGNVPDSVVSFLVNMKLSGYICKNLLDELVENKLQKVVTVSRKSLELVLARSGVDKSVLLLPDWICDYSGEMPIQEQLRQIQTYLKPFDSNVPVGQLDLLIKIYSAVVQVLEKLGPESNECFQVHLLETQPELDVLDIVERLCLGLDNLMYTCGFANKQMNSTTYTEVYTVLNRLKKVLDAARAVVFHQSKSHNLETKLKCMDIVYKLSRMFLTLETCSPELKLVKPEATKLEKVFSFSLTGFDPDHVLIDWYHVQFERYCYGRTIEERPKLEAKFIAAVITILVTSLSDSKQCQSNDADVNTRVTKSEAKIPDQVIQFLNFSKDREKMWTDNMALHRFIEAYLVYLALEPHLDLLERILDRFEDATDVHQKQKIIAEIKPFVESIRRNITKYADHMDKQKSLVGVFTEQSACFRNPDETTKHLLPEVKKLREVTDKILTHCDVLFPSPLDGSDPRNLKRLTEKLEDDYERHRRQGTNESTQLRTALEKAYKTAQAGGDSYNAGNCRCIGARIQSMLAGLDLEDGKIESAIQRASEAFNHQLYCQAGNYQFNRTIEVLFDAFSMCYDSQALKLDLLRKLFNGHMDIYGPEHWDTAKSHNKLIRLLCSTGSIVEAADFVEKLYDTSSSFPISYSDLTVVLLLLMSGETERVVSIAESMLRHVKAFNWEPYHQWVFDEICQFVTFFGKVCASGLASFKDHETSEFRKCFLIRIREWYEDDDQPARIYQEWVNNKVQFVHGNDNLSNEEDTSQDIRLINTTEQLDRDDLMLLWFDTMEQVLCREPKDISASFFAPLVRQLELLKVDMEFKLEEDQLEWSIKCFVGMFQRQQLWFQKTSVRTDETEKP